MKIIKLWVEIMDVEQKKKPQRITECINDFSKE